MRSVTMGVLAGGLALTLAGPASAQIISTSIPKGEQQEEKGLNFHLMAGYTHWDFAAIEKAKDFNTTGSGGNGGWIGAADLAFPVTPEITLGVGGWYNAISDVEVACTGGECLLEFVSSTRETLSGLKAYSLYGSAFYKRVGVQAGLVHSSGSENFSAIQIGDGATLTSTDTTSANDFDAFLVYRGGSAKTSFSVGAGIYRYASQPEREIRLLYNGGPAFFAGTDVPVIFTTLEEESSMSLSAFANASVNVTSRISIDASYWFIGPSGETASTGDRLNDTAGRFTIGVGVSL
jgi:hypothetical protein